MRRVLFGAICGQVMGCAALLPASSPVGPPELDRAGERGPENGVSLAVTVEIPPAPERAAQGLYSGPLVNQAEVELYDSLGNGQSYLVVRNPRPGSRGADGATVPVRFAGVAPGIATVTVRTSGLQPIGNSIYATGSTFVPPPISGGSNSPAVVFAGLLGAADNTPATVATLSILPGEADLEDGGPSGFGVGAATILLDAGQPATISVKVTQPPAFDAQVSFDSYAVDAGDTINLPVLNVQSGDRIALGSAPVPIIPSTIPVALFQISGPTASFTPTSSVGMSSVPMRLLRGSASFGTRYGSLPTITVYPASWSEAVAYQRTSALAAGKTDYAWLQLKDRFGNDVVSATRQNASMLVKTSSAPGVSTGPAYLIPGYTYGVPENSSPTATTVSGVGHWKCIFDQAFIAATPGGSAGTATISYPGGSRNITGISYFNLPYSQLYASPFYIRVASSSVPGFLDLSLQNSIGSTIASASVATPVAAGTVTMGNVLRISVSGLSTQDSATSSRILTYGTRAIGDTDILTFTISSGSTPIASRSLTYTWR